MTGTAGFASLYTTLDPERALDGLGQAYRFNSLTLKQYPSCFCNHAPIVAALDLIRLHDIKADAIRSGTIVLTPLSARLVGAPFDPGDKPQVAAQFSAQYSVANVFCRGRFEINDIKPEAILDPKVLALTSRFSVKVDPTLTGKFAPATLVVRLHDSREFQVTAHAIPGTPEHPLSDAQLKSKALKCFKSGSTPLSEQGAMTLMSRIDVLELMSEVNGLFS